MMYKITEKKDYFHVKFFTTIDMHNMYKLYNEIKKRKLMKKKKAFVFDLRKVNHIHYSCVRYLILIREQLNNNNLNCKIICNNPYIFSILDFMDYPIREDILPDIVSANHFINTI